MQTTVHGGNVLLPAIKAKLPTSYHVGVQHLATLRFTAEKDDQQPTDVVVPVREKKETFITLDSYRDLAQIGDSIGRHGSAYSGTLGMSMKLRFGDEPELATFALTNYRVMTHLNLKN
jgi:hypothetical protein